MAVLAGYGLLFGVSAGLTVLERRSSHQQLVDEIAEKLSFGMSTTRVVQAALPGMISIELAPSAAPKPIHTINRADQIWLESRTLLQRPGQKTVTLVVRQNITELVQRRRTLQLLLVAAAGLSSLFTSALLRPVLKRGLVDPIESLCEQLQQISSPSEAASPLDTEQQPSELQPVAASFNAMQQRLAAAWERERTFTDGAAHELRTPITLIMGQAQSLLKQPLPEPQRQTIEEIAKEAARMGHLVSDLLNLARQDSGRLQCLLQPLDPEALLLEAFDRLRPLAPERLQISLATGDLLPAVPADRERLLQCITALVENALTYAPGPVTLCVHSAKNHVIWRVQDNGPGIPDAEKMQIFKRFMRGSAAAGGNHRGSGLGLAVVQLLMEAMNGRVVACDAPSGGADFQLWLPITP